MITIKNIFLLEFMNPDTALIILSEPMKIIPSISFNLRYFQMLKTNDDIFKQSRILPVNDKSYLLFFNFLCSNTKPLLSFQYIFAKNVCMLLISCKIKYI